MSEVVNLQGNQIGKCNGECKAIRITDRNFKYIMMAQRKNEKYLKEVIEEAMNVQ
jgi:hypothetical protein